MSAYNPPHTPAPSDAPSTDTGLDPADWSEFRAQGHELWDALVDQMSTLREGPAWRTTPADVRERLARPAPAQGLGLEGALAELKRDVLPYPYGNIHPRFWGWVNGSGLPAGILGDLAASAMNSNTGAFDHSAVFVEQQLLRWLAEMMEAREHTDGLLTSGGSVANLLGLAAGITAKAGFDVRTLGLRAGPALTVYVSEQTHFSADKAIELMGLGSRHLRRIPVDEDYRIRLDLLREAVRDDRAAGRRPVAAVGNAGTVNTGATDDLDGLADLCAEEDLWLHVDGAFGALAWMVPEQRAALRGLQRADSIAFDLHKWLYVSSDIGCVLVKDPKALPAAFAFAPAYLTPLRGGIAHEDGIAFKDKGIELTRRNRALKAWLAIQAHGVEGFAGAIAVNLRQTAHLARLVDAHPALERTAPAPLNVVCYRFVDPSLSGEALDDLNRELLVRLQESGAAVPSHTVLHGAFCLRVANTNHRTRFEDFDLLVEHTARLGGELLRELREHRADSWLATPIARGTR